MNSSTVHSLGWGHGLRLNKVANPDATPDRKKKKKNMGTRDAQRRKKAKKKKLLCRTVNDRLCSNLKPKPYLEAFHQPTLAPKPGTNLCIASCCDRKTCVHLRRTFCIIPMRPSPLYGRVGLHRIFQQPLPKPPSSAAVHRLEATAASDRRAAS